MLLGLFVDTLTGVKNVKGTPRMMMGLNKITPALHSFWGVPLGSGGCVLPGHSGACANVVCDSLSMEEWV